MAVEFDVDTGGGCGPFSDVDVGAPTYEASILVYRFPPPYAGAATSIAGESIRKPQGIGCIPKEGTGGNGAPLVPTQSARGIAVLAG